MRPVVIPDDSIISLRIRIRHSGAFVTLDNRTYPISQPGDFTVRRAEERIFWLFRTIYRSTTRYGIR